MNQPYRKKHIQNKAYALYLLRTDEDVDVTFALIRGSYDDKECIPKLMDRYGISKRCAKKMLSISFRELGEFDVARYEKRHHIKKG